jgi:hypothetical protein
LDFVTSGRPSLRTPPQIAGRPADRVSDGGTPRCERRTSTKRRNGTRVRRSSNDRTISSHPARSASLPIRDILFPAARIGRNPAECRRFCSFIRTTDTGREARFGPFSVSLRPLSLTQPNHARFGTDVRTALIQLVRWPMRECGFERAALRRSERDSNRSGRRRDMAAFTQRPLTRRAVRRRSRA